MSGTIGDQQLEALSSFTGTIQDRIYNFLVASVTAGTLDDMGGTLGLIPDAYTTVLNDIYLLNLATLVSNAGVTLSNEVTAWGDSLTQGGGGLGAPADWQEQWPEWIQATWFTGSTINNEGIGGETTQEIEDRLALASAAVKQHISLLAGGTNDAAGSSYSFNTTLTNFGDMVADLADETPTNTVFGIMGGSHGSSPSIGNVQGGDRYMVRQGLIDTYAPAYVDFMQAIYSGIPEADWSASDDVISHENGIPVIARSNSGSDATHPNDEYGTYPLAVANAFLIAGLADVCPYIMPDITRYNGQAAATDVVYTPQYLGTPSSWEILAGNDDGLFEINSSTGVITRSATGTPTAQHEDLHIRANGTGSWKHSQRIRLLRGGTSGYEGVQPGRSGGLCLLDFPDCTNMTALWRLKFKAGDTNPLTLLDPDISGTAVTSLGASNRGRFQVVIKTSAGVVVASDSITPSFSTDNPEQWFWFGFCYNQATNYFRSMIARASTTATYAPDTVTPTGTIGFGPKPTLYNVGSSSDASKGLRDISFCWISDQFFDLNVGATRDLFFNSSTKVPVVAANGIVSGVTPLFCQHYHGPGDIHPSTNVGSHTNVSYNIPYRTNNYGVVT